MGSSSDPHRSAQLLEWVHRIRLGDVAAFESLFAAYYEPLVRFASMYLKSRDVAEELVQDVFLVLWEQRTQWQVQEAVHTYLYTMTRNRSINLLRRRSLEWRSVERALDGDERIASPRMQPADETLRMTELDAALAEAIDRLPERRREAFVLSRTHHMSYQEIARIMQISERTVQEQIARALKSLRASLAPWLE